MLDILFAEDSAHFKSKLIDIGNNRISVTSKSQYGGKNKSTFTKDQVIEVAELFYVVESETNSEEFYSIDMR